MAKYVDVTPVINVIKNTFGEYSLMAESLLKEIESYQAEDVAPVVHAKWKRRGGIGMIYCSACKKEPDITYHGGTDYCPNCGAKMDMEA